MNDPLGGRGARIGWFTLLISLAILLGGALVWMSGVTTVSNGDPQPVGDPAPSGTVSGEVQGDQSIVQRTSIAGDGGNARRGQTIRGRTVSGGRPVGDVRVELWTGDRNDAGRLLLASAASGTDGVFACDIVWPEGKAATLPLEVRKEGYLPETLQIRRSQTGAWPDDLGDIEITAAVRLICHARDPEGRPFGPTSVTLFPTEGARRKGTVTPSLAFDEDGLLRTATYRAPGRYRVGASGTQPVAPDSVVVPEGVSTVTIVFVIGHQQVADEGDSIEGLVMDHQGRLVAGALVVAFGEGMVTDTANARGQFVLRRTPGISSHERVVLTVPTRATPGGVLGTGDSPQLGPYTEYVSDRLYAWGAKGVLLQLRPACEWHVRVVREDDGSAVTRFAHFYVSWQRRSGIRELLFETHEEGLLTIGGVTSRRGALRVFPEAADLLPSGALYPGSDRPEGEPTVVRLKSATINRFRLRTDQGKALRDVTVNLIQHGTMPSHVFRLSLNPVLAPHIGNEGGATSLACAVSDDDGCVDLTGEDWARGTMFLHLSGGGLGVQIIGRDLTRRNEGGAWDVSLPLGGVVTGTVSNIEEYRQAGADLGVVLERTDGGGRFPGREPAMIGRNWRHMFRLDGEGSFDTGRIAQGLWNVHLCVVERGDMWGDGAVRQPALATAEVVAGMTTQVLLDAGGIRTGSITLEIEHGELLPADCVVMLLTDGGDSRHERLGAGNLVKFADVHPGTWRARIQGGGSTQPVCTFVEGRNPIHLLPQEDVESSVVCDVCRVDVLLKSDRSPVGERDLAILIDGWPIIQARTNAKGEATFLVDKGRRFTLAIRTLEWRAKNLASVDQKGKWVTLRQVAADVDGSRVAIALPD